MNSSPPQTQSFLRRHAFRLAASAIITFAILWAGTHTGLEQKSGSHLELIPPREAFEGVKWWAICVYPLFFLTMTFFRATRWRFLLRRVGGQVPLRRIISVSFVGFAAILLLPFRLGEFVRPALLRRGERISFAAATGSIIGERIIDGFYLSVVLGVALFAVPKIQPLPKYVLEPITPAALIGYAYVALIGFSGLLALVALYYFAHTFAKRLTLATLGVFSKPFAERVAHEAERLADGLHVLESPRDAAGFLFETTLYWGINATGMWFLAWACGVAHGDGSMLSFGEACALMGVLGITILIPGPPGLLGVFQAGMLSGLALYVPPSAIYGSHGSAYAVILFAMQLVLTCVGGLLGLSLTDRSLKEIVDADPA